MTRSRSTVTAAPTGQTPANALPTAGSLAFVGTGPGDPDLLTLRASQLIADADVLITETPEHHTLIALVRDAGSPEPEIIDGGFGEDGQPLTHASRAKVV